MSINLSKHRLIKMKERWENWSDWISINVSKRKQKKKLGDIGKQMCVIGWVSIYQNDKKNMTIDVITKLMFIINFIEFKLSMNQFATRFYISKLEIKNGNSTNLSHQECHQRKRTWYNPWYDVKPFDFVLNDNSDRTDCFEANQPCIIQDYKPTSDGDGKEVDEQEW